MSICFRAYSSLLNRVLTRPIHQSLALLGPDSRTKKVGHVKKKDTLEGEIAAIGVTHDAYELVDENVMDKVIDGVKFKDIPILYIKCTKNNTKITICDAKGNILVIKSAGMEGYKNCRKGTTVAAQAVANRVLMYTQDHDINMARLVFNGLGPGRGAAYKVFEQGGPKIVSLSDRTEAIEPWIRRPRKIRRV